MLFMLREVWRRAESERYVGMGHNDLELASDNDGMYRTCAFAVILALLRQWSVSD